MSGAIARTFTVVALVIASLAAGDSAPVRLGAVLLFEIQTDQNGLTAAERALIVNQRIAALSVGAAASPVVTAEQGSVSVLRSGSIAVAEVTDADGEAARKSRGDLARSWAEAINKALEARHARFDWRAWVLPPVYATLATAILLLAWLLLRAGHRRATRLVSRWAALSKRGIRLHESQLLSPREMASLLNSFLTGLAWVLAVLFLQVYLPVVLTFFPGTAPYAVMLAQWILTPVRLLFASFVAYLPDLFFLLAIVVVTRYLCRISDFIFHELGDGRLHFHGFYPEWAEPTSKLMRALLIILGVIMAHPYLPGSKSPAFQGVSIFLGVLLSLGSSSAVANGVAGTILTYMRAFQVGDRVKIADTYGDVVEKTLLITRIKTIKNEIITIPNSNVLSAQVINYSMQGREHALILHTSVSIGYDAPWRTVHELLIDAALRTNGIDATPAPFVFQTALNDFYVSYQINAYTAMAEDMDRIYSDLHQNIQDRFNEAGVEIMSPHYSSLRDGNTIAIPEKYRGEGYTARSFRVATGDGKAATLQG